MMLNDYYPLISAIVAGLTAQAIKPLIYYSKEKKWNKRIFLDSGGFPSSHASTVIALSVAIALQEHFSSPYFAISFVLSIITCYDAANIRYYAGRNIQITEQLIKDIRDFSQLKFDDPVYSGKSKVVLGHKWIEVIGGVILGILIALLLFLIK